MEKQYEALTDEELIEKLRAGESGVMDFLLEKYKYLVRKRQMLFLLGGDTDDLVQEGMIGLFKAVRDFDRSQEVFIILRICVLADRFIMRLRLPVERNMDR